MTVELTLTQFFYLKTVNRKGTWKIDTPHAWEVAVFETLVRLELAAEGPEGVRITEAGKQFLDQVSQRDGEHELAFRAEIN